MPDRPPLDRPPTSRPRSAPLEPWNDRALPDLYRWLDATGLIRRLLELARDEDLGPAGIDLTGAAVGDESRATVGLVAREAGACAGLAVIPGLLDVFGVDVAFEPEASDGDWFESGTTLAIFTGPLASIVRVERTILNLTSRLSGIATRTGVFRDEMLASMARDNARTPRLYDTRKTTPGLRVLEKYAVRCGGGFCHRMGLHDAVMFKDNHIAGIATDRLAEHARALVENARAAAATAGIVPAFIEFEADSLAQLGALLDLETGMIDAVLLDNMSPEELSEAVALRDARRPSVALEASGGVSLQTIGSVAVTGVDRISVGGLTHQARSIDLGFDADG